MTKSSALIFDFDGTIVDTETAVYESWADAYRFAGIEPIDRERWLDDIGQADGQGLDVRGILCERLGTDEVPADVTAFRTQRRKEMLADEPIRDGVEAWLSYALSQSLPLGVASSSPSSWVHEHLDRLGLAQHFPVVSCADPGIAGKPDPLVFTLAASGLQVDPAHCLAIEDSTHGVSAAIAAGMRCIAAPGPMTVSMDFSHATLRVDSLADLNPADWLIGAPGR